MAKAWGHIRPLLERSCTPGLLFDGAKCVAHLESIRPPSSSGVMADGAVSRRRFIVLFFKWPRARMEPR